MPHCEKTLYNSIIKANANVDGKVKNIVIFGNSFNRIITTPTKDDISALILVDGCFKEFQVPSDKDDRAFNDTSFHVF